MKTKQIRSNNSPRPLRLKIASGYILLIVLLGVIVFVVNNGKSQVVSLNMAERIVQEKRITVNRTFEQQARIDSVCMLLKEKEYHLCKVLEMLSA